MYLLKIGNFYILTFIFWHHSGINLINLRIVDHIKLFDLCFLQVERFRNSDVFQVCVTSNFISKGYIW